MKVLLQACFFLTWPPLFSAKQSSCSLDRVIEDVAISVVSETAAILAPNGMNLTDLKKCRPRDCADISRDLYKKSGVYRVWPEGGRNCGTEVYCDLEKDGGGWTVIQRRGDFGKPNDYFYKRWRQYKFGFGNITEDFWLGNDKISLISNQDSYELRVDLTTRDGESKYALYEEFYIGPETEKYKLQIFGYSGDAGDSLSGHSGQFFSTNDRDHDVFDQSCAVMFKGAWWYGACHTANLNGQYLNGNHTSFADGINWFHWKGHHFSYKEVVIKIRPSGFVGV